MQTHRLRICILLLVGGSGLAFAQTAERKATFLARGTGEWDKCTIEVMVDGIADVEIRGDTAVLRTLAGLPAEWRRFECSGPLTAYPEEFRFRGIDGRGSQRLVQDPRSGKGTAIVRIEDPRGGAEGYTFDIEWRGGGNFPPPADRSVSRARLAPPPSTAAGRDLGKVFNQCIRSVEERAARQGFEALVVETLQAELRTGQSQWIAGTAIGRNLRTRREATLNFSCNVNFDTGVVYSAELTPR